MKKPNRSSAVQLATGVDPGDRIPLNSDTPYGLFEGVSGSKYIVTHDEGAKVAVTLIHQDLPAFTRQALRDRPIDNGFWVGTYKLRLTHKRSRRLNYNEAGVIQIGGGQYAIMDCLDLRGNVCCIPLGEIGNRGYYLRDYDGWVVNEVGAHRTFFELVHSTNPCLTVQPVPEVAS